MNFYNYFCLLEVINKEIVDNRERFAANELICNKLSSKIEEQYKKKQDIKKISF